MNDELAGRAAERPVEQVADELLLRLLLGDGGGIDVRAGCLVTVDEAFLSHDLQELERGRIAGGPYAFESLLDLANGSRSALPESPENLELGRRGPGRRGHEP